MSNTMHRPENKFDMALSRQTAPGATLATFVGSTDELYLVEQLRSGNEAAFVSLIDRYAPTMLRLAMV